LDILHSLGKKAMNTAKGVVGANLAIPGPFDFAAGISRMRHKLPYLYGVDLRRAIAPLFGWELRQIQFLLDSAAFLWGEIDGGEASGSRRAVGITLGTGVGSAFAVNGNVVDDGHAVPPGGEIWNLPYEGGILEDFVSARSIQRVYEQRTGRQCSVAQIAEAASAEPAAREAFSEFGRHLGLVLQKILAPFSPDVVVLGGGISRSSHLFIPAAQNELPNSALQLKLSKLMYDAPLLGAGAAWFHRRNE
jgi:glucokinase